ncbi:hypothetical protein GCM10009552_05250 [Rothia nasimurium]|uniref:TetR/AcrR family transcriptional regulator n=1 Tax=Luteibacter anthropi TaxID=564369 RepID=A0A7X5UD20_9GAMM|nr:TetR/AcrR family transcriptional regulator [Luteibacter anthropi]NII08027.1 TetR/AcrR family transcriptional regulator [Luteibacter anthropi]
MPRPARSDIDAEIIDCASALFARHGFDNTSLQQIADAVGYSKAGLLHHFPSKRAIYDAALTSGHAHMKSMLGRVKHIPVGIMRDKAVVEATIDYTYEWPGVSAFAQALTSTDPKDAAPELEAMGMTFYEALGLDPATCGMERLVRVTSAFSGLGITALIAAKVDLQREWRDLISETAMDALGHQRGDR